jgi:predicted metal-dependent enzyme (double-stranded beta helix superfamily)
MIDIERFVTDCRAALSERSPHLTIKEIVERAMASPQEVERALGTPQEAKLITLYRSAGLTILNVIWAPGMSSYPHDHQMWAVIGLYGGREDNTFYQRSPQGLKQIGSKQLETQDTALLDEAVIHAVTNPLSRFTRAIHVYGGDLFAVPRSEFDPQTLEERPYNAERARQALLEVNERLRVQRERGAS